MHTDLRSDSLESLSELGVSQGDLAKWAVKTPADANDSNNLSKPKIGCHSGDDDDIAMSAPFADDRFALIMVDAEVCMTDAINH